jgi:antitoxin CptB
LFLEGGYPALDEAGQRGFARLLEHQDPEIYALLTGRAETDDPEIDRVVQHIRNDTGL